MAINCDFSLISVVNSYDILDKILELLLNNGIISTTYFLSKILLGRFGFFFKQKIHKL